jgi:hypothetical protein
VQLREEVDEEEEEEEEEEESPSAFNALNEALFSV